MFRIIFVRHQKLWHQLLALTSPFSAVPPDNRCPRIFRFLFSDFQWVYAVLIRNNQVFFQMWNCERQNSEDIEGEGPSRFKNWLYALWTTSSWAVDKLPHASVSSSPRVIVRVKTQENPWLIVIAHQQLLLLLLLILLSGHSHITAIILRTPQGQQCIFSNIVS